MRTVSAALLLLFGAAVAAAAADDVTVVPSCDSPIYCQGLMLDTLQRARLFNDSKTLVDLNLVNSADDTLEVFDNLMKNTSNKPSQDDLRKFLDENFAKVSPLDDWQPEDYTADPAFLKTIPDLEIRDFARELVAIWPKLGRKIKQEVLDHPDRTSLIGVPNGFIVPGGRFLEIYYWDSFWIVKGLLISEMKETARGMLENLLTLVEQFGFVPNGARVYYLNRSQPPLLAMMVEEYVKATNNLDWLRKHIGTLESEANYWLNNQTVDVDVRGLNVRMAIYSVASNTPRPESYREDLATCSTWEDESRQRECLRELKNGAESGWDFSTRWFYEDAGVKNLSCIRTSRNVPVDLNAMLQRSFRILATLYGQLGEADKAARWQAQADLWQQNIQLALYNATDGIWYDYDRVDGVHVNRFYPSNFAPLWTESYPKSKRDIIGDRAAQYFESQNLERYLGGVPTSLLHSGEQWDFPNAWPPLQDIVIRGLHQANSDKAKELARKWADYWVRANLRGFSETSEMFEKYDAVNPGQYGGGGEYVVQSGFGWTNGVVLTLIDTFYTDSKKDCKRHKA